LNSKTKILISGLLIRFTLAPFTGHPWDIKIWQDVGRRTLLGQNIYDVGVESNWYWGYYAYPPLWMIWCALSYIFSANIYLMILILKLPIIVSDVFAAQAIYDVILQKTGNEKTATKGFAYYFLNPFVILVGSIWGMFDTLPTIMTFISTIYLYEKKWSASALTLGLGIALKIYPAFLLPFYLVYMKFKQNLDTSSVAKYFTLSAAPAVIVSLPFLIINYKSYLFMIFFHAGHIGQLTYWFLLSHESYFIVDYGFLIFAVLFGALYLVILRGMKKGEGGFEVLNRGALTVLLAFFITSTKMNDHYFLWCIPYAITDLLLIEDKKSRRLFTTLVLMDMLFIILTLPINNFFLVSYAYNWRYGTGLYAIAVALIAIAPIFPLICSRYFYYLTTLRLPKLGYKRAIPICITLGIAILLLGPFPLPIQAQKVNYVVAVPESPAAGFAINVNDMGIKQFVQKYDADTIVLPFAPDFVNTYREYDATRGVEEYFKVRFDEGWHQSDVKQLVHLVHSEGKQVLVGVYFMADYVYNFKGYKSQWLKKNHPEILYENTIVPYADLHRDDNYEIAEGTKYYTYFSEVILKIVGDFDFDGVALLKIGKLSGQYTSYDIDGYTQFYKYVSERLHSIGKKLISEDFFGQDRLEIYEKIVPYVDYFIVQTEAWTYGIYFMNFEKNTDYYARYVHSLLDGLPEDEKGKILFTVETMDEQEGWFVPYFFLQNEIHLYDSFGLSGFAISHANVISPFTIRFER